MADRPFLETLVRVLLGGYFVGRLVDQHLMEQDQAVLGGKLDFVAAGLDVSDYESTQELARRIHADGHRIDILVNHAGIIGDAILRKLDKPGWDAVLRTSLDSSFNVTKPFIEPMAERGWDRIVNISSINGSKGQFGQTNCSAAKAGVHGFTKTLPQEVARNGVTVNTVSPGYLATEMMMAVREDVRQKIIAAIPVGRPVSRPRSARGGIHRERSCRLHKRKQRCH